MALKYDVDSLENRSEEALEKAARLIERTVERYHHAEVRGAPRIPEGAALYVGNHNSLTYAPEIYLLGLAAYRARGMSAVPYGLAHEFVLSLPGANDILCPLGAVRACHENGERILRAGHKALVYPGGDLDTARPYRHRNRIVFGGRRGYIRLALKTGTPIVPVVAAGAHSTVVVLDDMPWLARKLGIADKLRIKAWPLTLSIPWGLTLMPPPLFIPYPSRILMELLEPITFAHTGEEAAADPVWVEACDERVRGTMQAALDRLALEREG